jgi:hypothetical protein
MPAQFSKVFGAYAADMDNDGINDLVLAGNFFPYRVQLGRNDASLGTFFKGDGKGSYKTISNEAAGLFIDGDVRSMVSVKSSKGTTLLVIAKNDTAVQVIALEK